MSFKANVCQRGAAPLGPLCECAVCCSFTCLCREEGDEQQPTEVRDGGASRRWSHTVPSASGRPSNAQARESRIFTSVFNMIFKREEFESERPRVTICLLTCSVPTTFS